MSLQNKNKDWLIPLPANFQIDFNLSCIVTNPIIFPNSFTITASFHGNHRSCKILSSMKYLGLNLSPFSNSIRKRFFITRFVLRMLKIHKLISKQNFLNDHHGPSTPIRRFWNRHAREKTSLLKSCHIQQRC